MSASTASPGGWIPLMDYAMKKGVSLSTLRRYIKANKIRFKSEQGRYLIWDEDASVEMVGSYGILSHGVSATPDVRKIEELQHELLRAQEEISELKMLVALYEEQLFQKKPSLSL